MKKVLLFACIEKNIGDDLFIYTLCNRYKDVDFYISSDADYGDLSAIPNLHFSNKIRFWNRCSLSATHNPLKKMIALILKKLISVVYMRYDVAVYIVGNAFKNLEYKGKSDYVWIEDRIRLVKKFYLLSTNFGPYVDEQWKLDFDRIFGNMQDVCFRDKESYKLFEKLENVRYAPDTVLSTNIPEKKGKKEKQIIISLIDCSYHARSESVKSYTCVYESKLAEIIDYFAPQGYEITIVNSNNEQDMPATKRIYDMAKYKENVSIYEYNGDYSQVFKLYDKATFVIGTRLHTIILAWLYNIPVYPIVYDIKVGNMLKSYGFTGNYAKLDDLSKLEMKDIESAIENYRFERISKLMEEADKQFEMLDKELALKV